MKESLQHADVSRPVRTRTREPQRRNLWSGSTSRRAAVVSFGLAELVALGLRLRWARGAWFSVDDWDFLAHRTGGNLGDLFRSHYGHWATLIVLVYRFIWWVWGLNYLPYALFAIVLHLVLAALLRSVMRRAGVGPWVATASASVLVFFGTGIENNFFTSAMALGLTQLLLADHEGPVNRNDYLGLAAGLAALLCSGLAVTMTIVVGIAMLLRRGPRVAILHTAPLAAVFLIWLAAAPPGQSNGTNSLNPFTVLKFLGIGLQAGFGRLGQLPGFGIVCAAILAAGLALVWAREGIAAFQRRAALPIALFLGAMVFLVLTGAVRAGPVPSFKGNETFAQGFGPELARQGRYTYVVVAMVLPIFALAVDVVIRRYRPAGFVIALLLVVSLPTHVDAFRTDAQRFAVSGSNKREILTAARLPLAPRLPRSQQIGVFGGPPLGWLVDSLPSGRVPAPASLTPNDIASETLQLALRPSTTEQLAPCRTLTRPTVRVLQKGGSLTLKTGTAAIVYVPANAGRSRSQPFPARTVTARAGPLRLSVTPLRSQTGIPTVLCG